MTSRARTPQPDGAGPPVDYYAPASEYAPRPPSPPFIHIPARNSNQQPISLTTPSDFNGVDIGSLSPHEFALITGSSKYQQCYTSEQWHYELRRRAQKILDFVFLGPSSTARDVEFLCGNGITMVLGARDARVTAVRLNKIEQECANLGIQVAYVDVGTPGALIKSFSDATNIINQHLVQVYNDQGGTSLTPAPNSTHGGMDAEGGGVGGMEVDGQDGQDGTTTIPNPNIRRGKILVFCETGNDRSAAVVAAYIMGIFRVEMVTAVQYVQSARFCSCFDEETKQMLSTYQGLLDARRQTAQFRGGGVPQVQIPAPAAPQANTQVHRPTPVRPTQYQKHKRGLDETMDEDDKERLDMNGTGDMDRERYLGRNSAPFVDTNLS
ncbi:hypothetical protein MKZ38_001093 [Zalerion maritima]|uniref:Tyrosine specific protein phosphatases domain-containing protein n=1 Tax=Zalerion maritima TaxID=339359 RepID=A0AAD5RRW2_9PEZI|nr:hypothetical protein MKZ38_001093 [Zalerion maritima]